MSKRLSVGLAGCGLLTAVLTLAGGCGEAPGRFPVTGTVTYHGEPAAGATVYFHREGGDPSGGPVPSAVVEDDGSFTLRSGDLGTGALPGRYAVLVDWPGESKAPEASTPAPKGSSKVRRTALKRSKVRRGPDRLQGHYFDLSKPRLHAEVKPEANQLPAFDLKD